MELYVANEKLDITLQGEKTVGEVLQNFEKHLQENEIALTSVKVDGVLADDNSIEQILSKELQDDTRIDVEILPKKTLYDAIEKDILEDFEELISKVLNIPVELQSGKDKTAKDTIIALSYKIDAICKLVSYASAFPEMLNSLKIEDNNIVSFMSALMQILEELEKALQANDTVLIGDLAEYEICPKLEALYKTLKEI